MSSSSCQLHIYPHTIYEVIVLTLMVRISMHGYEVISSTSVARIIVHIVLGYLPCMHCGTKLSACIFMHASRGYISSTHHVATLGILLAYIYVHYSLHSGSREAFTLTPRHTYILLYVHQHQHHACMHLVFVRAYVCTICDVTLVGRIYVHVSWGYCRRVRAHIHAQFVPRLPSHLWHA